MERDLQPAAANVAADATAGLPVVAARFAWTGAAGEGYVAVFALGGECGTGSCQASPGTELSFGVLTMREFLFVAEAEV